jgi:hypothetical protein
VTKLAGARRPARPRHVAPAVKVAPHAAVPIGAPAKRTRSSHEPWLSLGDPPARISRPPAVWCGGRLTNDDYYAFLAPCLCAIISANLCQLVDAAADAPVVVVLLLRTM